jgi:hypothetical protein
LQSSFFGSPRCCLAFAQASFFAVCGIVISFADIAICIATAACIAPTRPLLR